MSRFIASNAAQLTLVPSSLGFWLPTDHQARFFNDVVECELDLSAILETCQSDEKRGRPVTIP